MNQMLADLVAALHVGYVACVVFGLVLILVGRALGWKWIANRWFRSVHLLMIVGVIIRALIWEECPMTWWERDLRGGFEPENFTGWPVGKVLHDLIHPDLPMWVFPVVYVAFGALIVAAFWLAPVDWKAANLSRPRPSDQCPPGDPTCPPIPPGSASPPPSSAGGAASPGPTSRSRS